MTPVQAMGCPFNFDRNYSSMPCDKGEVVLYSALRNVVSGFYFATEYWSSLSKSLGALYLSFSSYKIVESG